MSVIVCNFGSSEEMELKMVQEEIPTLDDAAIYGLCFCFCSLGKVGKW